MLHVLAVRTLRLLDSTEHLRAHPSALGFLLPAETPIERTVTVMNHRTELTTKYNGYLSQGHLLLAVTLSTYVRHLSEGPVIPKPELQSNWYVHVNEMRHVWDNYFIRRVERCLPYRAPLDHDYMLEPYPNWHYHGIVAVKSEFAPKLWKNGHLNPRLENDLKSFAYPSQYRPFPINSFDIKPLEHVDAWCIYITKQSDSISGLSTQVVRP